MTHITVVFISVCVSENLHTLRCHKRPARAETHARCTYTLYRFLTCYGCMYDVDQDINQTERNQLTQDRCVMVYCTDVKTHIIFQIVGTVKGGCCEIKTTVMCIVIRGLFAVEVGFSLLVPCPDSCWTSASISAAGTPSLANTAYSFRQRYTHTPHSVTDTYSVHAHARPIKRLV